jgi:hypothetical protein
VTYLEGGSDIKPIHHVFQQVLQDFCRRDCEHGGGCGELLLTIARGDGADGELRVGDGTQHRSWEVSLVWNANHFAVTMD